jgi:predicted acyltransferase
MDDHDTKPQQIRLASIDAYRGLVMFLLLAEAFYLCDVATAVPDSYFWQFLCHHQSHATWIGTSLHDLIMPSFCFLVGVSLPFSIAGRMARGAKEPDLWRHAVVRSLLLIALGWTIAALYGHHILINPFYWVLPQIGLGYVGLFWLGLRPTREAWACIAIILLVCWLAFALYPLPAPNFDYAKVGVSEEWLHEHGLTGFSAHWQKNSNIAWAFDTWLLNLFPRQEPFLGFSNGLTTLNFIPTLATMILGLIAGRVLRSEKTSWDKIRWLTVAGILGLTGGWTLGVTGICPVIKWIWTPSWVLFSGGWCFLLLAGSFLAVDVWGYRRAVLPLTIIGMNSIAAYLISMIHRALAFHALKRIVGRNIFISFGEAYEPLVYGIIIVAGYWMILYVMYRRHLYLRL